VTSTTHINSRKKLSKDVVTLAEAAEKKAGGKRRQMMIKQ